MSSENILDNNVKKLEESLFVLNYAFRKHRDYIKEKFKISALEMELIQFVVQNGPQKMKTVSEFFDIKLSTLTSIIDKAENQKILKRTNSKEDRRVVFLDCTRKGKSIYEEYGKFLHEIAFRMQTNLNQDQFHKFVESIETFTQISVPAN
ncbi:MAG: MarR family winged helix-turn-helix transcriptional regulator [Bacteroidia bacterium]